MAWMSPTCFLTSCKLKVTGRELEPYCSLAALEPPEYTIANTSSALCVGLIHLRLRWRLRLIQPQQTRFHPTPISLTRAS